MTNNDLTSWLYYYSNPNCWNMTNNELTWICTLVISDVICSRLLRIGSAIVCNLQDMYEYHIIWSRVVPVWTLFGSQAGRPQPGRHTWPPPVPAGPRHAGHQAEWHQTDGTPRTLYQFMCQPCYRPTMLCNGFELLCMHVDVTRPGWLNIDDCGLHTLIGEPWR